MNYTKSRNDIAEIEYYEKLYWEIRSFVDLMNDCSHEYLLKNNERYIYITFKENKRKTSPF